MIHRLNHLQDLDNIFVLSAGKIFESGDFFHLMEKRGVFYKLYLAQFDGDLYDTPQQKSLFDNKLID
jgi:ATP-binding cassette, subfamily B, multidrug efflux pump